MISMNALWIILTGSMVAVACALVGSFLVLRKISMLGDAISHAVLPGIVIAYLVAGGRNAILVFAGAVIFGVITTFIVQFLANAGIQGDAGIGVAFTMLFAIGVVLISLFGEGAHIDLDHVLYGEIAYAPFDMLFIGDVAIGPRALWLNAFLVLLNIVSINLLYKQMKLCAFDPGMAGSVGISVSLMHYILMFLVSVTCVGAFESVGAILVVAMLIVPPATAYLLSDNLARMLWLAAGIGILSSIFGYYLARAFDVSIAGSMAASSGILFAAAFLFSPRYGYVTTRLHRARLREQEIEEDILLSLWREAEAGGKAISLSGLAGFLRWNRSQLRSKLESLRRRSLISLREGSYVLTERGAEHTRKLMRRHRLYETYLEKHGVAADHVHFAADRNEHFITEDVEQRLSSVLSARERDPHGKRIPDSED
jgi:manganese/zinc/iron transport system permease protein